MKNPTHATQGASLVLVVLIVLMLLAAVMAVTAQMTLAGRKSTADQENTLRAQYAAESTVARAQAKLNIINRIFQPGAGGTAANPFNYGINVPDRTTSTTMATYIEQLCNLSAGSLPAFSQTTPVCGTSDPSSNILANVTDTTTLNTRLALFVAQSSTSPVTPYINAAALAAAGGPAVGSSMAVKQQFWANMFASGTNIGGTVNGLTTEGQVKTVISSVWRTTDDEYAIHLRVPSINVRASGNQSARAMQVLSGGTDYVLKVGRPPFAKYALFTNHHFTDSTAEAGCADTDTSTACNRITFTSNTRFSGPVFSNEQFNFQGNPVFSGPVASAGCVAGSITTDTTTQLSSCGTQTPGAWFGGVNFQSGTTNPSGLLNANGTVDTTPNVTYNNGGGNTVSSPQFNHTPSVQQPDAPVSWVNNYKQLPPNANDQSDASQKGGLYINGTVTSMKLSVATVTPTSGTAGSMQIINYTKGGVTKQLAINSSGQVFINTTGTTYVPAVQSVQTATLGEWVDASSTAATGAVYSRFNGVVYVKAPENTAGTPTADGISNLYGPARNPTTATTSTSTNTPPAIASFMKLNVTSNSDVKLTSDLRYEDPPCTDAGVCNNLDADNVLGIYSSKKDVTIVSPCTTVDRNGNCTTTTAAPPNVTIQAVLMAGQGKVTVGGYANGPADNSLGNVNLTGGIIENYYGAFGTVTGTAGTGFGRNFIYDPRTSQGILPPKFPIQQNWDSSFITPIKLNKNLQVQQTNAQYKTNTGTP